MPTIIPKQRRHAARRNEPMHNDDRKSRCDCQRSGVSHLTRHCSAWRWVASSGRSLHGGIRRCALSAGIRPRMVRFAGQCGGSCAAEAISPFRASRAPSPPPIPPLRSVEGIAPDENMGRTNSQRYLRNAMTKGYLLPIYRRRLQDLRRRRFQVFNPPHPTFLSFLP